VDIESEADKSTLNSLSLRDVWTGDIGNGCSET
jgi:hypothetical protein